MDTLADFRQAIQDDLTVGSESTLYSVNVIDRAINRAYRKCAALFPWPETEDAKKTSTQANQEYYDYPSNWLSDSMFRLEVDGDIYGEEPDGSPMDYNDYLTWRNDDYNANSTDRKWANQKRRFFFYPVPTSAGSYNIHCWGHMVPDALSTDGDVTIWSYSMPEGNEAIVLEAVAILKAKGEQEKAGEFRSLEAKQILIVSWGKIQKEQGKYEKINPFFDVPDYFGDTRAELKNKIGQF